MADKKKQEPAKQVTTPTKAEEPKAAPAAPAAAPKTTEAPKAEPEVKTKAKAAKTEAKKVVKDAFYRVSGGKVGNPPEKARLNRERR